MLFDKKRICALLLALALLCSMFPVGTVLAAEETELTAADYAEADLVFDLIDKAESAPATRSVTQEQKTQAAMEVVMASDSYVEGSLEQSGNSFTWWTENGIRCVYSPRMRKIQSELSQTGTDAIVNEPAATRGGTPNGNQVYLVGPYYGYDSNFTDQYKNEAQRVADAIGDTDGYTLYSGEAAAIDKVAQAVSNGAVVFFDSHGTTDYENPNDELDFITGATCSYMCLTSTDGLTVEDYEDGAAYDSKGAFVNGASIANHMTADSPNGILWMALCLGMGTDGIHAPLREKGVEVVCGYTQSVTFEGDYLYEETFWGELTAGKTVAQGTATMKEQWGNWDWSTQIADEYGSNDGYATIEEARENYCAFPVVVSDEDTWPGQRTGSSYGADSLQTVQSTYTLGEVNAPTDPGQDDNTAAASGTCGDDLTWVLTEDGVLTVSGTGDMTDWVNIPDVPWYSYANVITDVVMEEGVTSVGSQAFNMYPNVKSVVLPEGVTKIGYNAFQCSFVLESLELPSTLTYIGGSAFATCSKLTSIVLPEGLTEVGTYAFYNCSNVKQINLPSTLQTVGECAFGLTGVSRFDVPASLTQIGLNAFGSCRSLTGIYVDGNNPNYTNDECGVLLSKDQTTLIQYPCGRAEQYVIPKSVTTVAKRAFYGAKVTGVTFHDGVTSIGDFAFNGCTNLTEVNLPSQLTAIPHSLFSSCENLQSVSVPRGVTNIGAHAFEMAGLTRIELPTGITAVDEMAFSSCNKLTEVVFAGNAPTIHEWAFMGTTTIAYYPQNNSTWTADVMQNYGGTITWVGYTPEPQGVTWKLENGTLTISGNGPIPEYKPREAPWYETRMAIKRLVIEEGVTSIGAYAFMSCDNMVTVTLADTVTEIGNNAFDSCDNLTGIDFGEGLTTIGNSVFRYCTSLKNADLPESLLSMGSFAFAQCTSLEEVRIPSKMTEISHGAYAYCSGLKQIEIPEGVTAINEAGLRACSSLTQVVLPESVTFIGVDAFLDCTGLKTVNIPQGVTVISNGAFSYCSSLEKVVIPQGVTLIDTYGFYACESLKEILIPDSVTTIGDSVFEYCYALTEITFPNGVTTMGKDVFAYCTNLSKVCLPDSITSIGSNTFYNCDSLYQITLPAGITEIPKELFAYCDNLRSVTIPAGVTHIGRQAFNMCTQLIHVLHTGTAEQWAAITIEDGSAELNRGAHHDEAKGDEFVVQNKVTCTGTEIYRCTICGAWEGETNPKGKHSFTKWSVEIPSTCTEKGTERRDCTKCDYYETREKALSDHTYTAEVTPPTNLTGGYTTYTCVCGDTYQGKFTKPLGLDKPVATAQFQEETRQILVNWEAVPSADYYEVYRSTSSKKNYKSIGIAEGTQFADSSISSGKTYYYKVQAICKIDEDLDSDKSAYVSAKCLYPQVEITEVTTNSSGYPQVKWGKIKGAKKYQVYYATSEDGEYKRLTTTSSTSYTYKKAKRDTEYFFKVRAYGSSSSYAGLFSEVVSGYRTLARPSISLSTSQSKRTVTIKWKSVSKAIGYELQCSVNGGEFVTVAEGNILKFVHTDLAPGNQYTYRLRAISDREETYSRYSSTKSSTIKVGKPVVTITLAENGKPQLTWDAVDGAVEYQIYYATSKKGSYKRVETTEELTFIYEAAKKGKTCYFKVRAVDINGTKGDYSSYVKIKSK